MQQFNTCHELYFINGICWMMYDSNVAIWALHTHTVWYRVSIVCLCTDICTWHSLTQCVTLHVIITKHTHTVIDILTACFIIQAVSWQPVIVETQLQSQAYTLGFVVEKVALRQVSIQVLQFPSKYHPTYALCINSPTPLLCNLWNWKHC